MDLDLNLDDFVLGTFRLNLMFSGSHISSISRSVVPSLSGSCFAIGSSTLLSFVGASLLVSAMKASSYWFFCRLLPMSLSPYSRLHLPLFLEGDRSGLHQFVPGPAIPAVSPLSCECPGRVDPLLPVTLPSADFCIAVRVSLDSLSPFTGTRADLPR